MGGAGWRCPHVLVLPQWQQCLPDTWLGGRARVAHIAQVVRYSLAEHSCSFHFAGATMTAQQSSQMGPLPLPHIGQGLVSGTFLFLPLGFGVLENQVYVLPGAPGLVIDGDEAIIVGAGKQLPAGAAD
jgi:hypothetical protein